jgi:hypothetical protein
MQLFCPNGQFIKLTFKCLTYKRFPGFDSYVGKPYDDHGEKAFLTLMSGGDFVTNTKSDHAKNQVLDLFTRLQLSLQQHDTPERYQYVLNILETGISKVKHNQQTPERQARVAYDQIASQVFVDKLHFTTDENKVLTAINELTHSQKGWGEFSMLGTTNTWPSQ